MIKYIKILQRQLNFIHVELHVSLISEHEDVIPSEISRACQGTTVETQLKCSLQCMSIYPIPLLADDLVNVPDGHISNIAFL